jgi:hypothetical protein
MMRCREASPSTQGALETLEDRSRESVAGGEKEWAARRRRVGGGTAIRVNQRSRHVIYAAPLPDA